VGPLLVLAENGAGQERAFHGLVPVGGRLRMFGTVPPEDPGLTDSPDQRARALVSAPVETLIPTGATSYRRWTNHSWWVVEHGGQTRAGEWTPADAARLNALVDRAHALGLWIRFYALNGHTESDAQGWSAGYNFGSATAAGRRWRAAIDAGVDFVATDQYEAFAAQLRR
jgi:hypothetical protein